MVTKEQEQVLRDLMESVSKTLISTMNTLDLKTHIETTSISDGYKYKLRFDKEKI